LIEENDSVEIGIEIAPMVITTARARAAMEKYHWETL
jgi:hypothetical protein